MQLGSWETAPTVRPDEPHDLPGGTSLSQVWFVFGFVFRSQRETQPVLGFYHRVKFVCLFVFTEGWFCLNVGFTNVDHSGYSITSGRYPMA